MENIDSDWIHGNLTFLLRNYFFLRLQHELEFCKLNQSGLEVGGV